MSVDSADAYEQNAERFLALRDESPVGREIVKQWANALNPRSEVLEIGCGGGFPITQVLIQTELNVWAIDSSPTLLSKFEERFPNVTTQCEKVQNGRLFDRSFDAVISVGLLFLLDEPDQALFIERVAKILRPNGRLLFTAPLEIGTWKDSVTGHECLSLGHETYEAQLEKFGFVVVDTYIDVGQNNYYEAIRLVD